MMVSGAKRGTHGGHHVQAPIHDQVQVHVRRDRENCHNRRVGQEQTYASKIQTATGTAKPNRFETELGCNRNRFKTKSF
jgi:hypothetical protein